MTHNKIQLGNRKPIAGNKQGRTTHNTSINNTHSKRDQLSIKLPKNLSNNKYNSNNTNNIRVLYQTQHIRGSASQSLDFNKQFNTQYSNTQYNY